MKIVKYLMLLLLITTASSTAYSQITGISRDQKIEIVSTLKAYPIVLEQLDLQLKINIQLENAVALKETEINVINMQLNTLKEMRSNDLNTIELLKDKIKNTKKRNCILPAALSFITTLLIQILL